MPMLYIYVRSLRQAWLVPQSQACMSVLLQLTNHILNNTASTTNKAISLSTVPAFKPTQTPRPVRLACQRLRRAHRQWKKASPHVSLAAKTGYSAALKQYKHAVRTARLYQNAKRDEKLLSILGDNPSSLYSFMKSARSSGNTLTEKLFVGGKCYDGELVPDGFYDAMTSLKSYNQSELEKEVVAEQLSLHEHIIKL